MSVALISAGVGVAATTYSIVDAANKNAKANQLEAANKRPFYQPSKSIGDVYNLNLSDVNDTRLLDYAGDSLASNESNGIDAILKSGGKADFSVIHGTYGTQLKSMLDTIQRNRDAKIAAFNNAAYNKAKSEDASFEYNQDAPFKDAKQQEALLRSQAAARESDAFKTAASTVADIGIATTKPGQYGNPTVADISTLDRSDINPNIISSNDLRTPGATIGMLPAASNPTLPGGNYPPSGGETGLIIGFDHNGNPIYGH